MRISDWSSDVCSSDLVVTAAPITGTAQAGGSTTTAVLAALASAVDDAYLGMPIQHANVGTAGTVKGTSMIMDYNGTTKTAVLAETLGARSEEHTSELQSLMRTSYAVFCLKKKN